MVSAKILTPSLVQAPRQRQYPLFLQPDQGIRLDTVMTVLRATYQGTVLAAKAQRPIGYERTAESHIIVLDDRMPKELKGVIWQAVSTPLGSPYMPLFNTIDDIPDGYTQGDNQYGPLSAYWSFRGLYSLAKSQGDTCLDEIVTLWKNYERSCLREHVYIKAMLTALYRSDPNGAIEFTKRYSTGIAYQTVGLANGKRNELMTKVATLEVEPL
nr:C69 family dipeptidase [Alkalilimnicola ehrlichii]